MTDTITPKLAKEASIAWITPGRRRISPSDADGPLRWKELSAPPISSAICFVSGRTSHAIAADARLRAAAASQGRVNAPASTCFPANNGLNTVGHRMAPHTEPTRTYEI